MADDSTLSAHEAALASERRDRAQCLLGVPELIAGVRCAPLTPRRLEWLRAYSNPFVCGGMVSSAVILQFLWFVSPDFVFDNAKATRDAFIQAKLALNIEDARDGIEVYLERAFLDAPTGEPDKAYYAPTIGWYHALNESYPHGEWTLDRVLDTPVAVITQLIKAADKARGCTVINRRSYKAQTAWLTELVTVTADTRESISEAIAAKRLEGYKLCTLPEQSMDKTWACAMRKEASNGG